MLRQITVRRLAALLALASVTNAAGLLDAQGPTPGRGIRAPTKLTDCDATASCGIDGGILNQGGGGTGGGSGGGVGTDDACGTGSRVLCRTDNYYKCLKYVWVDANGNVTATPKGVSAGASGTAVCSESVTSTVHLFWP